MNAEEANKIATETRRKFIETLPVQKEVNSCLDQIRRVATSEPGEFYTTYSLNTFKLRSDETRMMRHRFLAEMTEKGYKVVELQNGNYSISWESLEK